MPPEDASKKYLGQGSPVEFDKKGSRAHKDRRFIGASLLSKTLFEPLSDDPLAAQRSFIRHDPELLAQELLKFLQPLPFRLLFRR